MNVRLLMMPLLLLAGCVTRPAVSPDVKLDPASRPQCEQHCSALGLKMTAVVIYSNRTGCVCQAAETPVVTSSAPTAAVTAAGEVVNEEEEEEARRQRDADQRRRNSRP